MPADNEKKYHEFKIVFEEYYNALCNYAYTYLKETNISEDIVQEVFVKVWEKRQDLIDAASLRFYLFTAVRNNCLTHISQRKKELPVQANTIEKQFGKLPDDNPEEQISYLPLINKALSLLPPKCKEVFLLSRISNMSYKEIAKTLGISTKTVENQIGKALKILRSFIRENKLFTFFSTIVAFQFIHYCFVGDFTKLLFF